jgi:dihydromethanopterin reductase (acceptor)
MKVIWCVTGAGHLLKETFEFLRRISAFNRITLVFSRAGYDVARSYGIRPGDMKYFRNVILEKDVGGTFTAYGKIYDRYYDMVVVAPCTANTAAKLACGIADTLVTNIVSQSIKSGIPVYIIPTDTEEEVVTELPLKNDDGSHKKAKIRIRRVDIKNILALSESGEATVMGSLGSIPVDRDGERIEIKKKK